MKQEKKCSMCNIIKPLERFYHDNRATDKHRSECKLCTDKKDREYYKKNKERKLKSCRDYHIKNREKMRIRRRESYQKNKEEEQTRSRVYRKNNEGKCREAVRKHYYENKEYYMKKRAAREKNFGFVKLFDNFFPSSIKIIWHHINDMIVIPIPKEIHTSNLGLDHREKMVIKIKKLYGLDVTRLLSICLLI